MTLDDLTNTQFSLLTLVTLAVVYAVAIAIRFAKEPDESQELFAPRDE